MATKKNTKQKQPTKNKNDITENKEVAFLEEQANTLLELANNLGLQDNYLFNTTFNRYLLQLQLLKRLNEDFKASDSLVSKEYVKGRENITAHPLITKINQTIDSSNKTASLLFKLISNASDIKTEQKKKLDSLELFDLDYEIDKLTDEELKSKYGITREEAKEQLAEYKYFGND